MMNRLKDSFQMYYAREYLSCAREMYLEVSGLLGDYSFPLDKHILAAHVRSRFHEANIMKVKTRMLLLKQFVTQNINGVSSDFSFLDVGGSSSIFFEMMKIKKIKGCVANIDESSIYRIVDAGYNAILVKDERLPFEDDSFDYVLSFQTLEHTFSPLIHIKEMKRVSRNGFFVSIPYRNTTTVVGKNDRTDASSGQMHIFEFSTEDLHKVAEHCDATINSSASFRLESRGQRPFTRMIWSKFGFGKLSFHVAYFT